MNSTLPAPYPPGVPATIDPDRYASLATLFEESCERFAGRPAFHNLGVTLTFGELDELTRRFAGFLQSRGLVPGDRIALMMPNVLQYPVALFGALRAGLVIVNTNPLYTARELRHQLMDSGARAIVILENFGHVLQQVRQDSALDLIVTTALGDLAGVVKGAAVNFVVRRIRHLVPPFELAGAIGLREALLVGARAGFHPVRLAPEDIAFLQYTGGTTGVAKGAVLTHRNMIANVLQVSAFWHAVIEPGREIIVTPLPLYHVFCLTANCLLFVHQGGLNVLITNPRDIPAFVRELRRWRFTMISGVNTLYAALLEHPGFAKLDFSGLKLGAAGGMALHAAVARRWQAATGKPLVEGYGLTEASPVVACNPSDAPTLGTVGLPLPSTEISIRDGETALPSGERGELWVRGPQVMREYWKRPEETSLTLTPEGWLRTGDIAVLRADGFLSIVDRMKDLIIVSGFKVFPNELEEVIGEHPAVLEAGCIGVPDERSGQAVKVFLVPRAGCTLTVQEVHSWCRERLTAYKIPKHIEFRAALPKSHVGKVLRRELAREESGLRAS